MTVQKSGRVDHERGVRIEDHEVGIAASFDGPFAGRQARELSGRGG